MGSALHGRRRRDPPPRRWYFEVGRGFEGSGRRIDHYNIPGWIGLGAIDVCRCAAAARSAKAADLCVLPAVNIASVHSSLLTLLTWCFDRFVPHLILLSGLHLQA